jgi:hypothetical protein
MTKDEKKLLSRALHCLLLGDVSAAEQAIHEIKPEVMKRGEYKDAIRGLLALIEDRAAEYVEDRTGKRKNPAHA